MTDTEPLIEPVTDIAQALGPLVNSDVRSLSDQIGEMPLQIAAGPAIKFGILNWILTWSGYYLVPEYVQYLMGSDDVERISCDNVTNITLDLDHGATYSKFHAWGVFLPGLMVLVALEVKCLQYVALPIVQVIGNHDLLCGFVPREWKFRIWAALQVALSVLAKLDLVTTGIFLATAVSLFNGPYGQVYDNLWIDTMDKSGWISLMPAMQVRVLWWFMFSQAVYGALWSMPLPTLHYWLAHGCPRCFEDKYLKWALKTDVSVQELRYDYNSELYRPFQAIADEWIESGDACCTDRSCVDLQKEIVDFWTRECIVTQEAEDQGRAGHKLPKYELASTDGAREFVRGGAHPGTMYQTLLDVASHYTVGKTTWSDHGTALFALAFSTRMASITGFVLPYSKQRVEHFLHLPSPDKMSAFGVMSRLIRTHTFRVILQGILQSGLTLNLQVSLFAAETLLTRTWANGKQVPPGSILDGTWNPTHWILNWGMFFNILVGVGNFAVNWTSEMQTILWVRSQVWSGQNNFLHTDAVGPTARCWRGVLRRQLWWLQFMFVVYTLLVAWVIWQLKHVFTCPLSLGVGFYGCAPRPDTGFLSCV